MIGESTPETTQQTSKPAKHSGPNRRQRRAEAKIQRLKSKAESRASQLRANYFKQLQAFLDNPGKLSQEQADQAFKIALKKIFKDKIKTQAEFNKLIDLSAKHAKKILEESKGA